MCDYKNNNKWLHGVLVHSGAIQRGSDFLTQDYEKNFIDRYYKSYYVTGFNGIPKNDYVIYQHSNGICLLNFAKTHFISNTNCQYTVSFKISKNVDLLNNKVKGKRKKGGHIFNLPINPIGKICTNEDGEGTKSIEIPCLIPGRLLEINESLSNENNFKSINYIGIVMPRAPKGQYLKELKIKRDDFVLDTSSPNLALPLCAPDVNFKTKDEYEKDLVI